MTDKETGAEDPVRGATVTEEIGNDEIEENVRDPGATVIAETETATEIAIGTVTEIGAPIGSLGREQWKPKNPVKKRVRR